MANRYHNRQVHRNTVWPVCIFDVQFSISNKFRKISEKMAIMAVVVEWVMTNAEEQGKPFATEVLVY